MLLDECDELIEVSTTPLVPRQGNERGGQHRGRITHSDTNPDRTDIHRQSPPPSGVIGTRPVRAAFYRHEG